MSELRSVEDLKRVASLLVEKDKRALRLKQRISEKHGLTVPQMEVLAMVRYLREEEKVEYVTQAMVAQRIFVDPVTMSTITKNLERKYLLYKLPNPEDTRAKRLLISERAAEMFVEVDKEVEKLLRETFEGVNLEVLEEQASIILENIKKHDIDFRF